VKTEVLYSLQDVEDHRSRLETEEEEIQEKDSNSGSRRCAKEVGGIPQAQFMSPRTK